MDRQAGSDLPAPPAETSNSSASLVHLRYVGAVALLTLSRPEAGNSINEPMATELIRVASRIAEEGCASALVITGQGRCRIESGVGLRYCLCASQREICGVLCRARLS
jgi:1,4-dihydroxy-2-naphthoyl-CoA synthase